MKKEFNLSEKGTYLNTNSLLKEKWISEKDVKEFIKKLKEFEWFISEEETWEETLRRHNKFMNKLAGKDLI